MLLIGRRRIKLEGGEREEVFSPVPTVPFPLSERILFHSRPSQNALKMLKNVTRPPGPVYPYDSE